MPVTHQSPDTLMITSAQRLHTCNADKLAQKIMNLAGAVRADLSNSRPADAAARQIGVLYTELVSELGQLRSVNRLAGWTRKPAA